MPITRIDKPTAANIRQLLSEALALVGAQHLLKITVGHGRYTSTDISFNVNVALVVNGEAQTPARKLWKIRAASLGLKPEWIDKVINYGGKSYRIDGLRGGAPKYNVCVTDVATNRAAYLPSVSIVKIAAHGALFNIPAQPEAPKSKWVAV